MKHINKDSQEIIKELGKSGEGLSSFRVFLAKHLLFPLLNHFLSWEKAWDIYDKEGQKIIELASRLDKEKLFKRVLVTKLFGLECKKRTKSDSNVVLVRTLLSF